MSTHTSHKMHSNSLSAHASLNLSDREKQVLHTVRSLQIATDRKIMYYLGYSDPNHVRPRVTALLKRGILREVGSEKDVFTGRTVRRVEVAS